MLETKPLADIEKPWKRRDPVFTCSNGWTLEWLDPDDQALEGFLMGHCLGTKDSHTCAFDDYLSLRDPDGNPHVTVTLIKGTLIPTELYGRCNRYPRTEFIRLINEYMDTLPLEKFFSCYISNNHSWGKDEDLLYHEEGVWSDEDYRDNPDVGFRWRDEEWDLKREVSSFGA